MNQEYQVAVHTSANHIAAEDWHSIINPQQDLAMDLRLIRLLETALNDQARFWTVMIRNRQQQLIACACLSLFATDVVQSATGFIQSAIQRLRRRWPNALKLKVLFCGLPVPSGHSHLRLHDKADVNAVLTCLHDTMTDIARQEQAQLLVFKELNADQDKQVEYL